MRKVEQKQGVIFNMLIVENIRIALAELGANKMRSLLTMLGIIIGIGSVIAIMTVSASMTSAITNSFVNMGANNVTLGVKRKSESTQSRANGLKFGKTGKNVSIKEKDKITDEMLEELKDEYNDEIHLFSIDESFGTGTVSKDNNSSNISLEGINSDYIDTNDVKILAGRAISAQDNSQKKKVALVSDLLVDNLFSGDRESALGKKINVSINEIYYQFYIVGVYEYDTTNEFSESAEDEIETKLYVPIQVGKDVFHADDGYSKLTIVSSEAVEDVSSFANSIEEYVNLKYYRSNDDYEIKATTLSAVNDSMNEMIGVVSIAISFVAGISLLVGGIGVMNIMLVSITERTREIGIRKALGAKNISIRFQFIIEAVMICIIGGVIGILLGSLLGTIISSVMGYSVSIPVIAIVVSVCFSMAIGVFFGYYPANKAVKLNPIDALRFE